MRNRILKRPMFRMGGSTDGILSGLDTPKLDASRQGYSRGADVRQRVETIRKENVNSKIFNTRLGKVHI